MGFGLVSLLHCRRVTASQAEPAAGWPPGSSHLAAGMLCLARPIAPGAIAGLGLICRRLAAVFNALDSPPVRAWLERLVVSGAAVGFLVHLAVIGIAWLFPDLPQTLFEGLDESLLHAVYTPFSVILFYEVVLFVFACFTAIGRKRATPAVAGDAGREGGEGWKEGGVG